jgi:hypothetical protein
MDDGLAEKLFKAFWSNICARGWPQPVKWNELHETQREAWEAAAIAARGEFPVPMLTFRMPGVTSEELAKKLDEAQPKRIVLLDAVDPRVAQMRGFLQGLRLLLHDCPFGHHDGRVITHRSATDEQLVAWLVLLFNARRSIDEMLAEGT